MTKVFVDNDEVFRHYVGMSIAVLLLFAAVAQQPTFEVASVKLSPIAPGDHECRGTFELTPERLTIHNYPLMGILARAYDASPRQFVNAEKFPVRACYDIDAKAPAPTTRAEMMRMLQNLLGERCKLALHREKKEVSGYALLLASGGPKLQEHTGPGPDCAARHAPNGEFSFQNCSLDFFATVGIADFLGAFVTNETGLTATYDFQILFGWERPGPPGQPPIAINPGAPSVPAALQKQLGLRLEAKKITVDFIAIDAFQPPSAN